jgi:type IV pilus assembly protein PilV
MKNPLSLSRSKSRQMGVTLIEVLVSILLMSFALLGMAALQAQSMSLQTSATTRSSVAILVADLADRMRSNLTESTGYNTSVVSPTFVITANWAGQATPPATPSTDCKTTACNAAARATYDLATWRIKVRNELPRGSALISGGQQTGINVTIMWFDKEFRSGETLTQTLACTAAMTGGATQTCCPAAAAAPAGVRCHNTTLLP